MTEHTPGPWIRDIQFVYAINARGTNRMSLRIDDYGNKDEAEANTRLIAAAPDMYEALRAIIMGDHLSASEAYKMGSDALAKAEGR